MVVIECRDEVVGAFDEARRRNVATIRDAWRRLSVRDLIRFRIEREIEARHESGGARCPSDPPTLMDRLAGTPGGGLDAAVVARRAHEAFEAGLYFVIVNGRQVEALDEIVPLDATNEAVFLRLVPLQGG